MYGKAGGNYMGAEDEFADDYGDYYDEEDESLDSAQLR